MTKSYKHFIFLKTGNTIYVFLGQILLLFVYLILYITKGYPNELISTVGKAELDFRSVNTDNNGVECTQESVYVTLYCIVSYCIVLYCMYCIVLYCIPVASISVGA
jgi:hypothetical protein